MDSRFSHISAAIIDSGLLEVVEELQGEQEGWHRHIIKCRLGKGIDERRVLREFALPILNLGAYSGGEVRFMREYFFVEGKLKYGFVLEVTTMQPMEFAESMRKVLSAPEKLPESKPAAGEVTNIEILDSPDPVIVRPLVWAPRARNIKRTKPSKLGDGFISTAGATPLEVAPRGRGGER